MIDFASVQWAKKIQTSLDPLLDQSEEDYHKLAKLFEELAKLKATDLTPTEAQITVLLQNLHTKTLESLEAVRGGNIMVHFSGGGYEYERFLLRDDGRMPNHKYEAKRAS